MDKEGRKSMTVGEGRLSGEGEVVSHELTMASRGKVRMGWNGVGCLSYLLGPKMIGVVPKGKRVFRGLQECLRIENLKLWL